MAQKVGNLPRGEGSDGAVLLLHTVHQVGSEGMSQIMETLSLDPRGLQDAVIAFAEVHWASEVAMLVWNQGGILSEQKCT